MIRSFAEAEGLFEHVFKHLHPALTAADHADVLERLCWTCDDPDGYLTDVRDEWLRSGDRRHVEVALSFQEILPFRDRVERKAAFKRIRDRWPDLAKRCDEIDRALVAEDG